MKTQINKYTFDEIAVGKSENFSVTITEDMLQAFRIITGDINPLHLDVAYAKSKNHNDRVVYGMLTASMLSTLAGVYLPGEYSLIHRVEIDFNKPVYINDILTVTGTVKEKDERFKLIWLAVKIMNQNGMKVCIGEMGIGVLL